MNEVITVIHKLELNQLNFYQPYVILNKVEWVDRTEYTVETIQKTKRFNCMQEATNEFIKCSAKLLRKNFT